MIISFIQVGNLNAQHEKSQNVTVNPAGLLLGLLSVEYEKATSPKNSFAIRGNFFSRDIGGWDTTAFGAGGSYRFFPKKKAPAGFYFGPAADFIFVSTKYSGDSATGIFFSIGGEAGFKWILKGGFVIDVGANASLAFGKVEIGSLELDYGGFVPGLRLGLGYAFD
jgi:hypothetical protein